MTDWRCRQVRGNYQIIIVSVNNAALPTRLIITTDCCRRQVATNFYLQNLSQLELGKAPLFRTNQEKELIKKNLGVK